MANWAKDEFIRRRCGIGIQLPLARTTAVAVAAAVAAVTDVAAVIDVAAVTAVTTTHVKGSHRRLLLVGGRRSCSGSLRLFHRRQAL